MIVCMLITDLNVYQNYFQYLNFQLEIDLFLEQHYFSRKKIFYYYYFIILYYFILLIDIMILFTFLMIIAFLNDTRID